MSDEADLLRAIVDRPEEAGQTWLVLADLLEENGDPRHELIRLEHQPTFRPDLAAPGRHRRVVELLVAGVRPCVPTWTNSVGMHFVWCPPGSFLIGSREGEASRHDDEGPQHLVTLTRGFWIGDRPVTQGQWRSVVGTCPSEFPGDDRPADNVSWDDCQEFCRLLSAADGRAYRLPTEAEWEYAARAGTQTPYFWGDEITPDLVNFDPGREGGGVYREETTVSGTFPPNARGLYDMHGNVFEWCQDWYAGHYPDGPRTDPTGPAEGSSRVERGGSWFSLTGSCRSAWRFLSPPHIPNNQDGCRVCFTAEAHP